MYNSIDDDSFACISMMILLLAWIDVIILILCKHSCKCVNPRSKKDGYSFVLARCELRDHCERSHCR